MNRLHIIADTEDYGNSVGTVLLGLSPDQFRVITRVEDVVDYKIGPIYTWGDRTPDDAFKIRSYFRNRGGINMGDYKQLTQYIQLVYRDIQEVVQLYGMYHDPSSNYGAISRLEEKLRYRELTPKNGFNYKISRNHLTGNMNVKPESPRMEVIYNLLNACALKETSSMDKVESIKIGKPIR
jgi:hypothetical protein